MIPTNDCPRRRRRSLMALPDAAATARSRVFPPPQWAANGGYRPKIKQALYSSISSQLVHPARNSSPVPPGNTDAMLLLPLLIVLSTLLLILLLFLTCIIFLRRRRGISLREHDGPIDVSCEDLLQGDGGFEGVEERWLETVSEETRRAYRQAKGEYPLLSPSAILALTSAFQFMRRNTRPILSLPTLLYHSS